MQTQPTPAVAILRPKDASAYLGFGRSKLYELHEQDPTFPRKIRFSSRVVGWRKADLDAWLELKAKQAGGAA